jgi:hypothetical protein
MKDWINNLPPRMWVGAIIRFRNKSGAYRFVEQINETGTRWRGPYHHENGNVSEDGGWKTHADYKGVEAYLDEGSLVTWILRKYGE